MSRRQYILRMSLVFVAFLAAFGMLLHHLHRIQIVRHEELLAQARRTYTASKRTIGKRGCIYDRHGNLLVGNLACKDILAEPGRMPPERRAYIRQCLADILQVDPVLLAERFGSRRVEVVVKRAVPLRQARPVEELKLPGIRMVDCHTRYYPKGQMLANTLGFTDIEGKGMVGLERAWEEDLRPHERAVTFERDRKGRQLHRNTPNAVPEIDGGDLYLTIDEPIQTLVERELASLFAEHRPRRAYAVMAEPYTGAILAMAQYPSFDPNERGHMDPERWRNHIVEDSHDPGSVMKGVAIAAAIDHQVVTLNTRIDCESGQWYYGGRVLRDSGHSYGVISVAEIVKKSSNIGTAKIALMMGDQRLYQALRRFGFWEPTGLNLDHESAGVMLPVSRWDKLTVTRYPIGQTLTVTPLQTVQAYCALSNGGMLPQLHLVRRVRHFDGRLEEVSPPPRHRALRSFASREIVRALSLVTVEGGTATRAAVAGYQVAGKTGTAQKLVDGSYSGHRKYVASFIGFVPARDPAFVLLLVADEPSGKSYYGGTVCGPTFSRIAEQTLHYLNVRPMDGDDGEVALGQR